MFSCLFVGMYLLFIDGVEARTLSVPLSGIGRRGYRGYQLPCRPTRPDGLMD